MFKVSLVDTDSITVCKPDGSPFSKEETDALTVSINEQFPEGIRWELEFNISKFIVLKSKNYILYDGDKIKLKGSGLKSATLEPEVKGFIWDVINCLVFDRQHEMKSIYDNYIRKAANITDIKPWAKKMTLSETTFKSTRKNETDVIAVIANTDYKEGDKIWVFKMPDDTLCLAENFKGVYNKEVYFEKLFKATKRFETILDVKSIFPNYTLKKNKGILDALLS